MEALRLAGVSKRYDSVRFAVEAVDVAFTTGRVHAVIGENGAGKSTLLRMGAGLVVPDAGTVHVEGAALTPHTAAEALRRGVGIVQQHFALVPVFTVLENMVLGAEPRGPGGLGMALGRVRDAATRAFEQIGASVPLDVIVGELGVGDRQRVEIARILFRGARTLILDEPTAVLTAREAEALYAKLRVLAGAGCAVVVVTHKLDEVLAHADAVTVMRKGKIVETRDIRRGDRELEATALTRAIMGSDPLPPLPRVERRPGPTVLVLDSVKLGTALQGVSLRVTEGEIVGIAGLDGNGQDELVHVLGRLISPEQGRVEVGRVAVVYGDRQTEGLVLDATVMDNLVLGELGDFARWGVLDSSAIEREAAKRCAAVDVVPPDLDRAVAELSGGNQQKVVVARALARASAGARLLVLAHPTRGVDIGAARAIHDLVRQVADEKAIGVLVVSSDLDELRSLCHRVLVISRGRIVAELPPETSDVVFGEHMMGTHASPTAAA